MSYYFEETQFSWEWLLEHQAHIKRKKKHGKSSISEMIFWIKIMFHKFRKIRSKYLFLEVAKYIRTTYFYLKKVGKQKITGERKRIHLISISVVCRLEIQILTTQMMLERVSHHTDISPSVKLKTCLYSHDLGN